tara:strand:+ start:1104 stop:2639 length:1536 start_codon:yes stop_codon:yes gene_type:complete
MSEIRVNSIISADGLGSVDLPTGTSGIGSDIKFAPSIIDYNPEGGSSGISNTQDIVLTFDQPIQFSATAGNIQIWQNQIGAPGILLETIAVGGGNNPSNATISGSVLTINPTSNLPSSSKIFVKIDTVGVASTLGSGFVGENRYNFTTAAGAFQMAGGHEFTTGGYKYHIFDNTGPLVVSSPGASAVNAAIMVVGGGGGGGSYPGGDRSGGGGGGGGVIHYNDISRFTSGSYTVTIGAGGQGHRPGQPSYGARGNDTYITDISTSSDLYRAFGGGGGYHGGVPWPQQPDLQPWTPGIRPSDGGSGGGRNSYEPAPGTQNQGMNFGGFGVMGQGSRGMGKGSSPYHPKYFMTSGGGGGANGEGLPATEYNSPPAPQGIGMRGGAGGQGRAVPEFQGPVMAPHIPTVSVPNFAPRVGPQGYYGGGGGGGSGYYPSYPGYRFHGGGPGQGGGGHGGYYDPTQPSPHPFNAPHPNYAEHGVHGTGGGGGGNRGPYGSYYAGNGGGGIVMIRYSYP